VSGYGLSASVQRTFEVDKGHINLFEYDVNGNLIYYGIAYGSTQASDVGWKIQKFVYDVSGNLLSRHWANGVEEFVSVWNDRGSLSYL